MGGYHMSAVAARIPGLGAAPAWEGRRLACFLPQDQRHYLYDGLGSTRQLLDASQNVTDTYAYEAFGNLKGSSGSTPNPYRYVGSLGYYQTGSSLMHLGARYYRPEVGRFGQRDPAGTKPPTKLADYDYCSHSPVGYRDPAGLSVTCDWCEQWRLDCIKNMSEETGVYKCIQDALHLGPVATEFGACLVLCVVTVFGGPTYPTCVALCGLAAGALTLTALGPCLDVAETIGRTCREGFDNCMSHAEL